MKRVGCGPRERALRREASRIRVIVVDTGGGGL